ncbi:iron-containing alcohol dehydrogenase family protein [Synechococcus sp. AH-551-G15]|nr:iron-containing alcohol dehydrogenase family protein [Synechococcus sp. AH-551-G15]
MTTSLVCHTHAISPSRVIRGGQAWQQSLPVIADLCKRPLLLGRSPATQAIRAGLKADLTARDLTVVEAQLNFDCCEEDLIRLEAVLKEAACDCVIAAGGGKVLDAGKLLACRLKLPCITVPLSAATCAGWTALANIYSQDGAFVSDEALDACPDLLIFDHGLIRQAPTQTLASGIADALAKWYEASVGSGSSTDGIIQQAVQMARVLRDQLLIDAVDAISHPDSEAWVRVAEACGLTAGVIGGLGGAQCRTVAAHAVHNGLTQLPACHGRLHGEKVGFGILVQLRLEERLGGNQLAAQSRRQLLPLLKQLGVPVTLQDLGLGETGLHDLRAICSFACRPGSDLHHLPFEVTETDLLEALVSTDADSRSMSPSLETEA